MKTKVFLISCLMAAAAMGQVSHVVPPGTGGVNPVSPFNSWETAATNILEAVNAAIGQGWTNVWVSNGTYILTNQVIINVGMTVRSWHDGAIDRVGTIVNGGNLAGNPTTNRCFYISHADAVVVGFTITNGWAYGSVVIPGQTGGGVYINNGLLLDCAVLGCKAQYMGGGVMARDAGVVRNCLIQGNTAQGGAAGAYVYGGALDDCDVISNYTDSSGGGGGIYLSHAGIVTNTRVKSNYSVGPGGGVRIVSTEGGLTHSEISANSNVSHGAGVYIDGGGSKVEHCTVNGNISYYASGRGGGIYLLRGAAAAHCIISNNVAMWGGGLGLLNGVCAYSDITGNLGRSIGGGVYMLNVGLVENCRISHNISSNGGGVCLQEATNINLRNCLIAGNVSTGSYGGGVHVYLGTGTVFQNSTIVSNYTPTYGGGVYLSSYATTVVENCVVYFNKNGLGDSSSNFCCGSANVICNNSCVAPSMDAYGVNNTVADPQFVAFTPDMDASAWNFNLRAGSPCVNTGTNQPDWMLDVPDLAGRRRIDRFSGLVDMGCYEYVGAGTLLTIK